jgi:hypothetical protein
MNPDIDHLNAEVAALTLDNDALTIEVFELRNLVEQLQDRVDHQRKELGVLRNPRSR